MTAVGPVTCRCGLSMRPAAERDAWECRCGLSLNCEAAYGAHHAGQPIPDAAFHQGEPWQEREPGLRVSDRWSDIGDLSWSTVEIDPARFPAPEVWQRLCANAFECSGLRYVGKPKHSASTLTLDSGESLQRHRVYALVPLGQEAEGVAAIVRFIRRKHGTGKLWAHGDVPIGPLKKREQSGWRGAELSGVLHVVLGCYYYHKPIN